MVKTTRFHTSAKPFHPRRFIDPNKPITMKFSLCTLLLPTAVSAFAPSSFGTSLLQTSLTLSKKTDNDDLGFLPFEDGEFEKTGMEKNSVPVSAMVVSAMAGLPSAAGAAGPDWGLFEGRTGSLIHPTVMGGLFLYSAYTAYLGFQWRRQRTLGDEISALKATLPKVPTPVTSDGTEDEAAAAEAAKVAAVAAPIEKEIQALQQERKDIAASGPRDKHFSQGAFLAFLGTSIAIEVCSDPF